MITRHRLDPDLPPISLAKTSPLSGEENQASYPAGYAEGMPLLGIAAGPLTIRSLSSAPTVQAQRELIGIPGTK
jgi:hypothetical protein